MRNLKFENISNQFSARITSDCNWIIVSKIPQDLDTMTTKFQSIVITNPKTKTLQLSTLKSFNLFSSHEEIEI